MALQDILGAISAEADRQISTARSAHQKQLSQIREQSERGTARRRQEIEALKENKIEQMRRKAEGHAETLRRHSLLETKRKLLDGVYDAVVEELGALPDQKVEPLLRSCLKRITAHGEIRPAARHAALLKRLAPSEQFTMGKPIEAKGGFLFVSEKREQDFRFETIVHDTLKPETELETSRALFGSPSA